MAVTFQNIQDRVIALGNYAETDRTNIKLYINMALLDVVKRRRWNFMEASTTVSTVAGTATVALPAGVQANIFGRLRPVSTAVGAPTYVENWADFDYRTREAIDTSNTGEPQLYTIEVNTLYFFPTPDAVYQYTLLYWSAPTELSGNSDVPSIPDVHRDVLTYGALMIAAARDKDPSMYGFWQNQYEGQIEELRRRDLSRAYQSQSKARLPESYGRQYTSPF